MVFIQKLVEKNIIDKKKDKRTRRKASKTLMVLKRVFC